MTAEIITIGDELLMGATVNSNASWLGRFLTDEGFNVRKTKTVGDHQQDIIDALESSLKQAHLVIMTGGLGPTHDDVTKKALAAYFGAKLTRHQPTLERIKDYYSSKGEEMTESNVRQAEIPEYFSVLDNQWGTAPGMWHKTDNAYIVVLPGVPREMKKLMSVKVPPLLNEIQSAFSGKELCVKHINTAGIGESTLSDKYLPGLHKYLGEDVTAAFLPSSEGVTIRIRSRASSKDRAEEKLRILLNYIYDQASPFIYGQGANNSLFNELGQILNDENLSIGAAESCTGGLLMSMLTDIPGSSDYLTGGMVAYSNEVKINDLGVSHDTIKKHGAVSKPVALQMAKTVAERLETDIGIATTGIAGPSGGTPEKPVGTIWIGYWSQSEHLAIKPVIGKDRLINKKKGAIISMDLVRRRLQNIETMPYELEASFA